MSLLFQGDEPAEPNQFQLDEFLVADEEASDSDYEEHSTTSERQRRRRRQQNSEVGHALHTLGHTGTCRTCPTLSHSDISHVPAARSRSPPRLPSPPPPPTHDTITDGISLALPQARALALCDNSGDGRGHPAPTRGPLLYFDALPKELRLEITYRVAHNHHSIHWPNWETDDYIYSLCTLLK